MLLVCIFLKRLLIFEISYKGLMFRTRNLIFYPGHISYLSAHFSGMRQKISDLNMKMIFLPTIDLSDISHLYTVVSREGLFFLEQPIHPAGKTFVIYIPKQDEDYIMCGCICWLSHV